MTDDKDRETGPPKDDASAEVKAAETYPGQRGGYAEGPEGVREPRERSERTDAERQHLEGGHTIANAMENAKEEESRE